MILQWNVFTSIPGMDINIVFTHTLYHYVMYKIIIVYKLYSEETIEIYYGIVQYCLAFWE